MDKSVDIILNGGVVILPTETVYGLCCLANNTSAVNKIYKIKKRNFDKPMSILAYSIEQIMGFADVCEEAKNILKTGKTAVLKTKDTSYFSKAIFGKTDGSTIGVRIPQNEELLYILKQISKPIVATSVNISGEKAICIASDIDEDILLQVDFIVRRDEICCGIPSQIIDFTSGEIRFIRK